MSKSGNRTVRILDWSGVVSKRWYLPESGTRKKITEARGDDQYLDVIQTYNKIFF